MVWTAPITFYNGDPFTSAQLNTYARDNFLETGPGKATMASRLIVASDMNTIVERQWVRAYKDNNIIVDNGFPTTEDEEGNLYGPTVSCEHGGQMLIMYDAKIAVTAGGGNAMYAPAIDNSSPENSNYALRSAREGVMRAGAFYWATGLEPGISTITMCYGTSNNVTTAAYDERRLTVIPF